MHDFFLLNTFTRDRFGGARVAVLVGRDTPTPEEATRMVAELGQPVLAVLTAEAKLSVDFFTTEGRAGFVGDAALGAAYVVLTHLEPNTDEATMWHEAAGWVPVRREGDIVMFDLTPMGTTAAEPSSALAAVLSEVTTKEILDSEFGLVAVLSEPEDVARYSPNPRRLEDLGRTLIMTAAGGETDFVSRVFPYGEGILEDPVCGTAHRLLVPFWAERLGSDHLRAVQLSERRGQFITRFTPGIVTLGGSCFELIKGDAAGLRRSSHHT